MRIGIGKRLEAGRLRFEVSAPGLAPFAVELEKAPGGGGERAPDWYATFHGERCGAFWRKVPKGGGEAYLSGNLESPVFAGGRLEVTVFTAREAGSHMDMVWRPERMTRRADEQDYGQAQAAVPQAAAADTDGDTPPF